MSKNLYEIEIKSLLGSKENAERLVQKMKDIDPTMQEMGSHKQLNHYFMDGDLNSLYEKLSSHLQEEQKEKFKDIKERAKSFSVRTRWADGKVLAVVKASVDDTTSSNGTARIEFEAELPDLSLEQLDQIILDSGFKYQAKWSRERSNYKFGNATISIDKNAGYGYLAEFEVTAEDEQQVEQLKFAMKELMKKLQVEELDQARLERMFTFYNEHWPEYYGTEKTFTIE